MYSLPEVKSISLLVRPKAGINIMDRVRNEIFNSECFRLRLDPKFL